MEKTNQKTSFINLKDNVPMYSNGAMPHFSANPIVGKIISDIKAEKAQANYAQNPIAGWASSPNKK